MSNERPTPKALLWVDLETTGLDLSLDQVIEVGAVLTDLELHTITGGFSKVVTGARGWTPAELLKRIQANSFVHDMHLKNGLTAELATAVTDFRSYCEEIQAVLEDLGFKSGEIILAGSGLGQFDSQFFARDASVFRGFFPYYVIDVGVVRRFLRLAVPDRPWAQVPESSVDGVKRHRALPDAQAHLLEARLFRQELAAMHVSSETLAEIYGVLSK